MLAHSAAEIQPSAEGERLGRSQTQRSFVFVAMLVPRLGRLRLTRNDARRAAGTEIGRWVGASSSTAWVRHNGAVTHTGILDVERTKLNG